VTIEFLDPSYEHRGAAFKQAARLATLQGTTVGLISNGKEGTRGFFDALEQLLVETYGVANVVRTVKNNYSAPADPRIVAQAKSWDAAIAGVGD
jgi:hypothetical protein